MEDKIYYYNHNNRLMLTLNNYPYFADPSDFKDWSWDYSETFGIISNFHRTKSEYTLTIGIATDFLKYHDQLCDIFTADILAGEPGYLMLRGWKLKCYITESGYSYGHDLDRQAKFKVLSTDKVWVRSTMRYFNGTDDKVTGASDADMWRDYVWSDGAGRRGYNYNYNVGHSANTSIDVPGSENGYILTIYGPATDPTVYINNTPVSVKIALEAGEQLRITSIGNDKRIEKLSSSGEATNIFNLRDKEHSQFLTLGSHIDITYGQLKFDMEIVERRSEPSWS